MVPQGAEYKAVCRGLSRISTQTPKVLPIPVGIKPLTEYLQQLPKNEYFLNISQPRVLVMGLCGSLTKKYTVGDIVLYQDCIYQGNLQKCENSLTTQIYSKLSTQNSALNVVQGLTSDRVIWSAKEKLNLGEISGADVVDMEGFAALNFSNQNQVAVAMLRVVSDNCEHDIPDLTTAFNSDGLLQPIPLALGLLRQPVAATRLIWGSLRGLKVLEQVTKSLFSGCD